SWGWLSRWLNHPQLTLEARLRGSCLVRQVHADRLTQSLEREMVARDGHAHRARVLPAPGRADFDLRLARHPAGAERQVTVRVEVHLEVQVEVALHDVGVDAGGEVCGELHAGRVPFELHDRG